MDLEDFVEAEVGVAVAVTAAVTTAALSPTVRGWLRKGAVYGLAGVLIAKDRVVEFAQNVREGAREATQDGAARVAEQAPAERKAEGAPA
jgi:hypothetical protein